MCDACNAKYDQSPELMVILDAHRQRGRLAQDAQPQDAESEQARSQSAKKTEILSREYFTVHSSI